MYNSHILHSFSYKDTIHEEILLAAMFSQQRDNMRAHTRLRDAATLLQDNRATGCEFARNISTSSRRIIMIKKDFSTVLALNGFRICGNVSHASLTTIISASRVKRLLKEHIIEKVSYQDKHISKDRNQTTYRLTAHGKDVTRNFLGKGNFQSGRGNERHNTALAEAYSQLSKDEQYSAMNELDLKEYLDQQYYTLLATDRLSEAEELYENMKHMSLIDLTYCKANTQELCCIEVITKNYSTEKINLKEFTATEVVHATYNEINIY